MPPGRPFSVAGAPIGNDNQVELLEVQSSRGVCVCLSLPTDARG